MVTIQRRRNTSVKRFSLAEHLPQQNAKPVHVKFGGSCHINVSPVFRRNVSDSSTSAVTATHF